MNSNEEQEVLDAALTLIHSRQHVSPKRLGDPGPDREQVEKILTAAGAAPDHGQLTPWRLIIVPPERRQLLADAFAEALAERDEEATEAQRQIIRGLLHPRIGLYAPCMILVSLLGMSPITAFPIMMGSCAFLMPVAGVQFIRKEGKEWWGGVISIVQHLAVLGAGARGTHYALGFHHFDDAGGAGVAYAHAALQHGDGGAAAAAHQVHSVLEHRVHFALLLYLGDLFPNRHLL